MRLPTGRLVTPAGERLLFHGRPVDLELSPGGRLLFVKDWKSLRVVDCKSFALIQTIRSPGQASLYGLAVTGDGRVLLTNAQSHLHVYAPAHDGKYLLQQSIELPPDSFPCGVTLSADDQTAYVCLSKRNSLAIVNLQQGILSHEIAVGVAPFDVAVDADGQRAFVSNLGGRRPLEGDTTAPSAGTETVVDERGVASTGTVSVVNLTAMKVASTVQVGLHPSALLADESSVFLCNTNQDSLAWIRQRDLLVREIVAKPRAELPFGSMPNALAKARDGKLLFVALAGNNAVGVLQVTESQWELIGLIPTAWYPSGLQCDHDYLYVANTKGIGARSRQRAESEGWNSHDHSGMLQKISLSCVRDPGQLRHWTQAVIENSHVVQAVRAMHKRADLAASTPVPVPRQLGEPSVFRHVIYVIKENRTFDQVFGDIEQARSQLSLCVFPAKITPNHHALARRFGILDNYYCNGVLSADGHSWATEGNVTPYLERAFGGFARSYTFGDDPITYSSSGFLWDRVLAAGLSFRNYGEMDNAKPPAGMGFQEVWQAYQDGKRVEFEQQIGIERLRRYTCRTYPGWNLAIPDVLRMERFLEEFSEFERNGDLPNLCIVYLPQDHLGGGVTSRAHMADNDLALGRLVEAVSHSKFWDHTVIFVNEDDPQGGYDHIDGHRSLCLAVSAYSRSGVNHGFYNQTSVLRTILRIFGLPPLNQQDASSPLMSACFAPGKLNSDPYVAIDPQIRLNETPKPEHQQSAAERHWRARLATVPIERTGLKSPADDDTLNRFVWHEQMGWQTPYPADFAGFHGRGLATEKLILVPAAEE